MVLPLRQRRLLGGSCPHASHALLYIPRGYLEPLWAQTILLGLGLGLLVSSLRAPFLTPGCFLTPGFIRASRFLRPFPIAACVLAFARASLTLISRVLRVARLFSRVAAVPALARATLLWRCLPPR